MKIERVKAVKKEISESDRVKNEIKVEHSKIDKKSVKNADILKRLEAIEKLLGLD